MQNSKLAKANYPLLIIRIIGVFLISIIVTFLFWAFVSSGFHTMDATDYLSYYEPVAHNLLNGIGFVRADGTSAIIYPPGYSLLLAGVFAFARVFGSPESLVISGFILLCMGLSSTFVFLISEMIWGAYGGWVSALFFMTYPFVLWLTKQPNSELPFMAVFYASLYLFWLGLKGQKNIGVILFLAGIFAGAAMLIRAIAIGTGFLLSGLFLALKKDVHLKRRFLLAGVLLLGNFLAILPWQVWVYGQTEQVVLLGTNGVSGIKDGLTFAVETKNYRQGIVVPMDVTNLQNEFVAENASLNSLGDIFTTIEKHTREEPVVVLKLVLIKMARSWYGTDSGSLEAIILIIQFFYATLFLTATISIWRCRPEIPGLLLFVWSIVFYFWMMTIAVLSILRYMTPVFGVLSLLAPSIFRIRRPIPRLFLSQ